jgi:energy-coupling factor transporter ATP-binding protein EcfA2
MNADDRSLLETRVTSRDLGSISAEDDSQFSQHFVNTSEFMRLLKGSCMIVAGAKGSGKTALMRALADIDSYTKQYATVYPIKLDGLKFGPLFLEIKKLNDASSHGLVAIARSTWQNVIGIFVLEALLKPGLLPSRRQTDIRKYLYANGYLGMPAGDKLMGHLERVWRMLSIEDDERATEDPAVPLGLHAKQQQAISSFPSDQKLADLLFNALSSASLKDKQVLLCFDGLDSVIEHSLDSRDYIFAGLIDAVFKCATHPDLRGKLVVKALIPKELAHGARRHLRDLDKIDQYTASVHWNAENLSSFIKRRLEAHTKTRDKSFADVWYRFFPEKIWNVAHEQNEESYQYILRHTLYRPRQLLFHVQNILDYWDARPHAPFRVDPTFIPKIVADTNGSLAEYVVNELSLDFPALSNLLKSLRGLPSVISWPEMSLRIGRYLGVAADKVEESFTDLFNYGIFGVLSSNPPTDGRRSLSSVSFGFMTRVVERHVAGGLTDRSTIVLAPMFAEYCGCRTSSIGMIYPTR